VKRYSADFRITQRAFNVVTDYWGHLRLLSRNARLFLVGIFFVGINWAVFWVLLNLYFKELGFTEDLIGQVLSFNALGMAVVSVPAALIMPRVSIKKILVYSVVLAGFFYLLQATLVVRAQLLSASLLLGMSATVARVAAAPFMMRNSTTKERTYLFSLHFGIYLVAGIVGSLGGGQLPGLFSSLGVTGAVAFRYALYVSVGMGFLSIIPFLMIKQEERFEEPSRAGATWNKKLLAETGVLLFKLCFPFFIVGLGAGFVIPFLNLYFRDRFGVPTGTIGTYFAVQQIAMLGGILSGPVLSKRFGMIKTVVFTQLASMPFMLILAFTHYLPAAVVAFVFRASLMNMGQPISTNFAMEKVKEREQALTNALLMLSWTGSWAVSANLGGKMIEAYGFTPPLLITIGLYFVSSVMYYVFFSSEEDTKMGKAIPPLRET
jgi:MFS family permease